jgi:hypothetical protein
MIVSQETSSLIVSLQGFSRKELRHADDLGALIEISKLRNQAQVLEDLCFLSKFLVSTRNVMERIGREGEGYDKRSFQFAENLEKASTFIRLLIKEAPEDLKRHFTSTYFGMTSDGLSSLMELLSDLRWLKNWNIDHASTTG